jgi:hypothetical protein
MDSLLKPAAVTAFDAVASMTSLAVYLGVAILMLARRSGDSRARVFLVVALTSAVPYVLTALQWRRGSGIYTPAVTASLAAAFSIGSAALFHFTQVFPARRPWIQRHFLWVVLAYVLIPVPVAGIAWVLTTVLSPVALSGSIGAVSVDPVIGLIVLMMLPAVLIVGVVLPLAGVLSLVKSWQEAKRSANEPARSATFWMLMSQMGGGILAVLVIPLLPLVGIGAPWTTAIGVLVYGFALLMPIAFLTART